MTVLIKDGRFHRETLKPVSVFQKLGDIVDPAATGGYLDLPSDTDPSAVTGIAKQFSTIRIAFPTSADGRGNSIAKALRNAGYQGELRACGHILAEQYPLALRCGFDVIEISEELASRQNEALWLEAYKRIEHTYLNRLQSGIAGTSPFQFVAA